MSDEYRMCFVFFLLFQIQCKGILRDKSVAKVYDLTISS